MSNQPSDPLDRQLVSLMASNREDSFGTQRKRSHELKAAGRELKQRFGLQKWDNLKEKHVQHLVERWKGQDQGHRSIDQKLSHFRWLLSKIGKPNLLPRTNSQLGVEAGPRHTRAGVVVNEAKLAQIREALQDPGVKVMVDLARQLGLRFEEAALLRPSQDWQGTRVWIKRGSKGGRPRYLNLHNQNQVAALKQARDLCPAGRGIIPETVRTYEQWRQYAYRQLQAAGVGRNEGIVFHDLRRTYAVSRMHQLTTDRGMTQVSASILVSRELGHSRTEILNWYIASE